MNDLTKIGLDPQAIEEMPEQAKRAHEIAMKTLGSALLRVSSRNLTPSIVLKDGQMLRDSKVWEYPILPGAISVFQQLAAGREWVISGKPRAVSRAVEWINNAQVIDRKTGIVYYGYENFLKRRVLDYLTIGRTSFAVKRGSDPVLEYLDPAYLKFKRANAKDLRPVRDNEVCWYYDEREFKAKEIFIDHPLPIGTSMFIAPVAPILPTATLAWLIREHQTASVDGRKIRDIIFVANPAMKDAMIRAINAVAALWAGETVEKVGMPIVELNNPAGVPVEDLFALLGLSRLPENFKQEEFWFMYVNEIAGNLSLALRHFWNSERTTNKALEEVQEKRGQMKGPSTFVRTEQRLMNRPGVLDHLGGGTGKKVRFGFMEETDASSRLDNAQVLLQTTTALEKVATVFGATISPDAYLAWMQSLGVLPNELELLQANPNKDQVQESDNSNSADPDNTSEESDKQPSALASVSPAQKYLTDHRYFIDYDEVAMNGQGQVVDRRVKTFTVTKLMASQILAEQKAAPREETAEEAFERGVAAVSQANQVLLRKFFPQIEPDIQSWTRSQFIFKKGAVSEAIQACLDDLPLTEHQQRVVDEVVGRFIDEPVEDQ